MTEQDAALRAECGRPEAPEIELVPDRPARVMLLGGEPFPEPILMSWNFVARTRDAVDRAAAGWNAGDERFGTVHSTLDRVPAPSPGLA